MPPGLLRQCLVLLSTGALIACATDVADPVSNTEFSVFVRNGGPSPIRSVEYTIGCAGSRATPSDEDAGFPDEVRLDPQIEYVDGGLLSLSIPADGEELHGFLDLPPGPCSIELRGRDEGGEVRCIAEETFSVVAGSTTEVEIVLDCELRFSPPTPMPVPGGNSCPELLGLRCDDLDSGTRDTSCEVRFRDEDSTCDQGCDPQLCILQPEGLSCTPGPDPGVSTTITCTNGVLDCTGDGTPDPSCTVTADTPGALSETPDELVAEFFVTCAHSTDLTITCTAIASDGDLDCDKIKLLTIDCRDVDP